MYNTFKNLSSNYILNEIYILREYSTMLYIINLNYYLVSLILHISTIDIISIILQYSCIYNNIYFIHKYYVFPLLHLLLFYFLTSGLF